MDKYELTQSEMIKMVDKNTEIKLDLQLKTNTHAHYCLIYGYITDCNKQPLMDVHLTFYDKKNSIIGSAYTASDGYYSFMGAKLKTKIKIVVKKDGYQQKSSHYICIKTRKLKYSTHLEKTPYATKTIICGHILDEMGNFLQYIPIYLFKSCRDNTNYQYTHSNAQGQFCFTKVAKGSYCIIINAPDYHVSSTGIEIVDTGEIYNLDISIVKCPRNRKIHGQIKDKCCKPIPLTTLILFRIEDNQHMIAIKHTISDHNGNYCFGNVPVGRYFVKNVP